MFADERIGDETAALHVVERVARMDIADREDDRDADDDLRDSRAHFG